MAFYLGEIVKLREDFLETHEKGDYPRAVQLGHRIVELYKENDDCHSMEFATDLNNLAIAYDDICLYDKASTHYKAAAKLKKEISGESISYADTLNNLAILYSRTKNYQEAVKMQQHVLEIRDKLLGHNHADYILGLYNLGSTYEDMNLLEKALETQLKALLKAQRQNAIGKMDYADILSSLGRIYEKAGNYQKSMDSYGKAAEIIERSAGTDNFYYMDTLLCISSIAEKSSLFHKAAEYSKKAVTIRARMMDKTHLDYIAALNNLSVLYGKAKEFDKALDIHGESLEILGNMLGRDHVFYADTLNNMAMDYCALGDFSKAMEKAKEALALKTSAVGKNHSQYAASMMTIGSIYGSMERFLEAIQYYEEALSIRQALYEEGHTSCADTYMTMGKLYGKQGNQKKEQEMYRKALEIRRNLNAKNEPGYIWTLQTLAALLAKDGSEEMAMNLLWEACQVQKEKYGNQHPVYARALVHLARGYMAAMRFADAASAFEDAADLEAKMLGDDNPRYLKTLFELAEARYKNGEFEKAIACYKKHNDANFENSPKKQLEAAKEELRISNCYLQLNADEKAGAYFQRGEDKLVASGLSPDEEWKDLLKEKANVANGTGKDQKSEQLIKKSKQVYMGTEKQLPKTEDTLEMTDTNQEQGNYLRDAAQLLMKIYDLRIADSGAGDREGLRAAIAMGDIHRIAKDYDQAFFWYQKVEKNANEDLYAEACLKQAQIYLSHKKPVQAEEKLFFAKTVLEKCKLTETKEYVQTMGFLGDIYHKDKRNPEALSAYNKWLEHFKKFGTESNEYNARRLLLLGELLAEQQRFQEALEIFSEAALLIRETEGESPRFAKLLLKTAKMHILIGHVEKSIVLLEKASLLYKDQGGAKRMVYGKILEMLGNQYFSKQLQNAALSSLEKAYEIFSENMDSSSFTPMSRRNLLSLYRENKENRRYWQVKLGKKLPRLFHKNI